MSEGTANIIIVMMLSVAVCIFTYFISKPSVEACRTYEYNEYSKLVKKGFDPECLKIFIKENK